MHDFIIFYAPFIILIASIVVAFLIAPIGRIGDGEGRMMNGEQTSRWRLFFLDVCEVV